MASTDFEAERAAFREHYDSQRMLLEEATETFTALVRSLLLSGGNIEISKIEGRVKDSRGVHPEVQSKVPSRAGSK